MGDKIHFENQQIYNVKIQGGGRHHAKHDKLQSFIDHLIMLSSLVTIISACMGKQRKSVSELKKEPQN